MRLSIARALPFLKAQLISAQAISTYHLRSNLSASGILSLWKQVFTNPTMSASEQDLDLLLSWTALDFRKFLENGTYSPRQLVQLCLDQAERHNTAGMQLHALISILHREQELSLADQLDDDRKNGKIRGPFHGIPIIVKVLYSRSGLSRPCNNS